MLAYADVCCRMQVQWNRCVFGKAALRRKQAMVRYTLQSTYAGICSVCCRILPYADVCCRMLTYSGVLCRMLTYTDVCWRILTYADVCS